MRYRLAIRVLAIALGIASSGCSFEFYRSFESDTEPKDRSSESEQTEHDSSDISTASEAIDTNTETDVDTDAITTIGEATLAHRWRFDGDLSDEIGQSDAQIVIPDGITEANVNLTDHHITLSGGPSSTAAYVSLGSHLLTNLGGPASIEIFAALHQLNYFPRIFEFGSEWNEYINMTWLRDADPDGDAVVWWGGEDMTLVWDTNAPYEMNVIYHIVMTFAPGEGDDDTLLITWYTAPKDDVDMGNSKGKIETPDRLRDLDDENCWLGKSHSDSDDVAVATYYDVRLWKGILRPEDIETLHDLGTDM